MRNGFFRLIRLFTLNYLPFRKKNSLLVFIFHRVNNDNSIFFRAVPITAFEEMCLFLKSKYEVIHFCEVEEYYSKKRKKPAAIITFDDGMSDIIQNAFPILSKMKMKFNVNIDTEILETQLPQDFVRVYDILNNTLENSFFNPKFMVQPIVIDKFNPGSTEIEFTSILSELSFLERRKFVEDMSITLKMHRENFTTVLSVENILELNRSGLVEFGSHGHRHVLLTKISKEEIDYELSHSKRILERILGERINCMAYPNGESNDYIDERARTLGYTFLLKSNHKINDIGQLKQKVVCFERINQYHQSKEIMLAHSFGIIRRMQRIFKR
jgi:peptidoglycan/xylan/chitin deacetylase (PgdA/CDA1 family)